MWLLGLLTGVALTVLVLLQILLIFVRRTFENPSPDWSRPGTIWEGSMARAREVMENVFPDAPARSYLSVERFQNPATAYFRPPNTDTKLFVRSIGKRAGQHRFRIELRLDASERAALERAWEMVASVGPAVERIDKSYGAIVLMSEVRHDWQPLLAVADRFAAEILGCKTVHLNWHVAGRAAG